MVSVPLFGSRGPGGMGVPLELSCGFGWMFGCSRLRFF